MATLSQIRDWVRGQTLLETDDWSSANVNRAINQGLRLLSGRFPWPFLLTSAQITTIADTQAYALPADFNRLHSIIQNGERVRLQEIAPLDAWDLWGDDFSTSDRADLFFLHGNDIYLVPTPSANDVTYTEIYYKSVTTLDNDTDEPEWAAEYHYVLADYAIARGWEREEDFTKAEVAQGMFDRGVEEMAQFYFRRTEPRVAIYGESPAQRRGRRGNMPWIDGA